jgi:hypothetical protein
MCSAMIENELDPNRCCQYIDRADCAAKFIQEELSALSLPGVDTNKVLPVARALETLLSTDPQIASNRIKYLVVGSLAVAASTGSIELLYGGKDISLLSFMEYSKTGEHWLSSSAILSRCKSIQLFPYQDVAEKMTSPIQIECRWLKSEESPVIRPFLIPHPAVLTVLTAANLDNLLDEEQMAQQLSALSGRLPDPKHDATGEKRRTWSRLAHETSLAINRSETNYLPEWIKNIIPGRAS